MVMRDDAKLRRAEKKFQLDRFEERLAMSAQAVADPLVGEVRHDDCAAEVLQSATVDASSASSSRTVWALTSSHAADLSVQTPSVQTQAVAAASVSGGNANAGYGWSDIQYVRQTYGLTGAGQTVVMIDSGIAWDQQALGNGYGSGKKVVGGWDFAENDGNPYDDGPSGFHGTHTAGIVGASGGSYNGVASGVDLVSLRVIDDQGNSSLEWIEKALKYVHTNRNSFDNPITTVNMSLGVGLNLKSTPNWGILEDELAQLYADGIVVTVSAGNDFLTYNATGLDYPAVSSYVIPVGSANSNGQISNFSQRDTRVLLAPGENVVSTIPDARGNKNGIGDDWASATGTSMASPYVAGASALIREAMQRVGVTGINQDKILQVMRSTADSVYDAVTQTNYLRINLKRAIDTVMASSTSSGGGSSGGGGSTTTDDVGSTVGTARSFGNVATSTTFAGRIDSTSDLDYFSFTAGATGTATVNFNPNGFTSTWRIGNASSTTGSSFTINVVAGTTYTFAIGSTGGLGTYNLSIGLQATPSIVGTDLGTVSRTQTSTAAVSNGTWYSFTASDTGIVTAETLFDRGQGDVSFEVYNAAGQRIATSLGVASGSRFDFGAVAGQAFRIKLIGSHPSASLRITNLVTISGDTVTIRGTAGDDTVNLKTGNIVEATVNGTTYRINSAVRNRVVIDGRGGDDAINVIGTSDSETVTMSPQRLTFQNGTFLITASNFQRQTVDGGGGNDSATLFDSSGNDNLTGDFSSLTLAGSGFTNELDGFSTVDVRLNAGGTDTAVVSTGSRDSRLTYTTQQAQLVSGTSTLTIGSVENLQVIGGSGRNTANLQDSAGDDVLAASPTSTVLAGSGYSARVDGFEVVSVTATTGNDTATLNDSAGDDRLQSTPLRSVLAGTGFSISAGGFDSVAARFTSGNDIAGIVGSAGDDVYSWRDGYAKLQGVSFLVELYGDVETTATGGGGNDTASFIGLESLDSVLAEDDLFQLGRGSGASGATAYDFETILAVAKSGQRPTASVKATEYVFNRLGKWQQ
jgi:subtilisin family serine protease